MYSKFFKIVPGMLQAFVNPIDSIYIASAIAKTATQVFIILLLAGYISGKKNIFSKEFLVSAVLVTPLFITYQYWRLGIIDWAVTFVFFYAIPLGLLMLFFLPFFKKLFYDEVISDNVIYRIYLLMLLIIISLGGPLIPAVLLIVCPVTILVLWHKQYKAVKPESSANRLVKSLKAIPAEILFYFLLAVVLSCYSLYIGTNNIENKTVENSLLERYALIPNGFAKLFSFSYLLIPVIAVIVINAFIIFKYFRNEVGKKILCFIKWTVICSVIYVLLLPLGGFRSYRPYIIRYDTLMPVTLALITIFGITTYYLVFNLTGKFRLIFSAGIIMFLLFFCYTDKSTKGINKCQREALLNLSQTRDSIVLIGSNCNIMSWDKILDYRDSEFNAELLKYWGVTKEKKLYYQK